MSRQIGWSIYTVWAYKLAASVNLSPTCQVLFFKNNFSFRRSLQILKILQFQSNSSPHAILRVRLSGKLDLSHIQKSRSLVVPSDQAVSQKFPPTWHVRSTSSLPSPSGNGLSITLKSADDAKDDVHKRVWEKWTQQKTTCFFLSHI